MTQFVIISGLLATDLPTYLAPMADDCFLQMSLFGLRFLSEQKRLRKKIIIQNEKRGRHIGLHVLGAQAWVGKKPMDGHPGCFFFKHVL